MVPRRVWQRVDKRDPSNGACPESAMKPEDETPLSETARDAIRKLREAQARDVRICVTPRTAREMLGIGDTNLRSLMASGQIRSVLDGRVRRILTESLYDLTARRLVASYPYVSPPAKSPMGRFRSRKKV
jgi:hypothetical protein